MGSASKRKIAMLEAEHHSSLQRAKDQAASCTWCSWRRAIAGGSTAGADIKGCWRCMGSWYAKARLTQYNNLPKATSEQRWYMQKELCQFNALAEDPEETQEESQQEVAQIKQDTQVKMEMQVKMEKKEESSDEGTQVKMEKKEEEVV